MRFYGNDAHFIPKNDLVEHEPKNCVCMPELSSMVENLKVRWVFTHSALDGRKFEER